MRPAALRLSLLLLLRSGALLAAGRAMIVLLLAAGCATIVLVLAATRATIVLLRRVWSRTGQRESAVPISDFPSGADGSRRQYRDNV